MVRKHFDRSGLVFSVELKDQAKKTASDFVAFVWKVPQHPPESNARALPSQCKLVKKCDQGENLKTCDSADVRLMAILAAAALPQVVVKVDSRLALLEAVRTEKRAKGAWQSTSS